MRSDEDLAHILWDYLRVGDEPQPSDLILCLGNRDPTTAGRAAELYLQKMAPLILVAGGVGDRTPYGRSEADTFADIMKQKGVPESALLLEKNSKSTGENMLLASRLLIEHSIIVHSLIAVVNPYMERRTLATFEAQWPQPQPSIIVTSPQIDFESYYQAQPEQERYEFIALLAGYTQRIREYPKQGFQSEQPMPEAVWSAFTQLVDRGYSKHIIKTE